MRRVSSFSVLLSALLLSSLVGAAQATEVSSSQTESVQVGSAHTMTARSNVLKLAKKKAKKKPACSLGKKAKCAKTSVKKQKVGKKNYSNINLSGSDIVGSKFTGTSFKNANFKNTLVQDTTFAGVDLRNADFSGATLKNVTISADSQVGNLDLSNTTISKVTFKNLDFGGAQPQTLHSVSPSKSVIFSCFGLDANCSGVDLSHSHIDFINFFVVSAARINLSNSEISTMSLGYSQLSYSDLSNASIQSFSLIGSDFNVNRLVGTRFDEMDLFSSHMGGNTYVNASCTIDGNVHNTDFPTSYYLWSDTCKNSLTPYGGVNAVLNTGGITNVTIDPTADAGVTRIVVTRFHGAVAYATKCVTTTICTTFIDKGMSAVVDLTSDGPVFTSNETWACGSSVLNTLTGSYATKCLIETVADTQADTTINITGPPTVTVTSVAWMPGDPVPTYKFIKIFVGDFVVKTCNNAKSCKVKVKPGDIVHVQVASTEMEIYISKTAPILDSMVGNFDPPVAGIYYSHTNDETITSSVEYSAVLS